MSATEANRQVSSSAQPADRPVGWPAAPLRLRSLSATALNRPLDATTLCRISYGDADLADDPRCIRVPLVQLHGDALAEDWTGTALVRSGIEHGIRFADNGEVLMVSLSAPEQAQDDPEAAAAALYARLLLFIAARGYPHLLRVWNYLERINQGEADQERYRRFCVGRHQALAQQPDAEMQLPAASAIGCVGGGLQVHAFASRRRGLQVENPRQVSAFRYPRSYGLRSPSFSRATLAPWADGAQLFVSGTASIVGHATAHAGDVTAQLAQTATNLDVLRAHAAGSPSSGIDPRSGSQGWTPELYTVYLRHADDLPQVLPLLAERFADAPCKVLIGAICRRELLVEVEASYRIAAAQPRAAD